jgi:hypothetical protein
VWKNRRSYVERIVPILRGSFDGPKQLRDLSFSNTDSLASALYL